jgi:hypothetical protein
LVYSIGEKQPCHFYEALGGKRLDCIEIEIAGDKQNEIVFGWTDIRAIQL